MIALGGVSMIALGVVSMKMVSSIAKSIWKIIILARSIREDERPYFIVIATKGLSLGTEP